MGRFLYNWDSPPGGIFSIRANWSGDSNYIGSDSVVSRIVIIPLEWVMMGGILALCLIILVIVILATRGISSSSGESFSEFETEEYNY